MSKKIVRRKYEALFRKGDELIYVSHEDSNGYVHYQDCYDLTYQDEVMTSLEFSKWKKYTGEE